MNKDKRKIQRGRAQLLFVLAVVSTFGVIIHAIYYKVALVDNNVIFMTFLTLPLVIYFYWVRMAKPDKMKIRITALLIGFPTGIMVVNISGISGIFNFGINVAVIVIIFTIVQKRFFKDLFFSEIYSLKFVLQIAAICWLEAGLIGLTFWKESNYQLIILAVNILLIAWFLYLSICEPKRVQLCEQSDGQGGMYRSGDVRWKKPTSWLLQLEARCHDYWLA